MSQLNDVRQANRERSDCDMGFPRICVNDQYGLYHL